MACLGRAGPDAIGAIVAKHGVDRVRWFRDDMLHPNPLVPNPL